MCPSYLGLKRYKLLGRLKPFSLSILGFYLSRGGRLYLAVI